MELTRRATETPLQYHKRLVYGKLVDKTMADADYTELAEALYGQPYSSDVARRMLYGSKKTLDILEGEQLSSVSDGDVLAEVDAKIVELQKERQKFFDQRREYKKNISAEAREEHLYDVLADAARNLTESVGQIYGNQSDGFMYDTESGTEAVLVFSDWHYGMTASNVFNKYDTDICRERVSAVTREAAERIKMHGCDHLHIVVLGDLCHGAVHVSARVASEELVCDQLMQASEILAQSIEYLSQFVHYISVYTTYGNHMRTVQNKKDNIHRDNMERIIPWWLEQRFSGRDDIEIAEDTGNEFLFVNACGYQICASHGDKDSVHTSPRLLSTLLQKTYGMDIDYILLGDKHHGESYDEMGVTAVMCGSLCGTDDYANDRRLYSEPSQMLLIVKEDYGVDAEYRLKCGC